MEKDETARLLEPLRRTHSMVPIAEKLFVNPARHISNRMPWKAMKDRTCGDHILLLMVTELSESRMKGSIHALVGVSKDKDSRLVFWDPGQCLSRLLLSAAAAPTLDTKATGNKGLQVASVTNELTKIEQRDDGNPDLLYLSRRYSNSLREPFPDVPIMDFGVILSKLQRCPS
jgi:hypothetical protein